MTGTDAYATETPDQFAAFLAAVDRALTEQFGQDHQAVLSQGEMVSEFVW